MEKANNNKRQLNGQDISLAKPLRPSKLEINISALKHNFNLIKNNTNSPFVCPMVKANAYGHGVIPVVDALIDEGAQYFGLATFEEAIDLRQSDIDKPDLIVVSRVSEQSVSRIEEFNITPIVSTLEEVDMLDGLLKGSKKRPVHVMLDLGMNRLGIRPEGFKELCQKVHNSQKLQVTGVGTHFSHSEDMFLLDSFTAKKLMEFRKLTEGMDKSVMTHCFNSQGFLGEWISSGRVQEGVRPGVSLFGVKQKFQGLSSKQQEFYNQIELKPVMSLITHISHVQNVKKGETISYSGTWRADQDSKVGVLPIGYADGVRRSLSNSCHVLISGEKAPLVGTVCMDYSFIDLTHIIGHKVDNFLEKQVLFFGEAAGQILPIETVADWQGTIAYEVMTNMGTRLPRVYVESERV